MSKVTLLVQEEHKLGISTFLTYKLKKNGTANTILMSENLKILSYFKLKGARVLKDFKDLDKALSHIDANTNLIIDSLDMLKEKEIKYLVSVLKADLIPFNIYIVTCLGSKYSAKKHSLLTSCLSSSDIEYRVISISKSSEAVCLYNEENRGIKDITDIVKNGYMPLIN